MKKTWSDANSQMQMTSRSQEIGNIVLPLNRDKIIDADELQQEQLVERHNRRRIINAPMIEVD